MKKLIPVLIVFVFLIGSAGVSNALLNCEGSPRTISDYKEVGSWSNCEGTVSFGNGGGKRAGNKQVGEWKDGKLHGQGTYTFAKGNKFTGEFRNGVRIGQGTMILADGVKYVGEFRNGKPNGEGTKTYADGRKEAGVWENGKLKPGVCSKEGERKKMTMCVTKYWEEETWCMMNINIKI